MESERFFARNPIFTRAEFGASRGADGSWGERTPDLLLAHHVRAGHLVRVRRGLYAVVPTGMDPELAPVDGYLVASKLADDTVLAYHTALELHGVAHSVSERLLFLTKRKVRPFTFRSLEFRAVSVPTALRGDGADAVGVAVVDRSGLDVRATTLERTLVDVLDRPGLGGGWEEVWRSLEAVSFFNLTQIVDHALRLDNATTVAKVGFFLEQHQDALSVSEEHLRPLRSHAPAGPHYAKRGGREPTVFLPGWNLVMPESVVHRAWEEVS